MLIISWFVCGMLYFIMGSYIYSKIISKEKFKVLYKHIIFSIVLGLLNVLVLYLDVGYIRPYVIYSLLFFGLLIIYKQSFVKTLIGFLFVTAITFVAEVLFGLLVIIFKLRPNMSNSIDYLFVNLIISIMSLLILRIKIVTKIISNIIKWYNDNEYKSLAILIILILIIMSFLLYNNFIKILPSSLLLLTNIFCVAVFVFVIGFFKEKTNNNKIIYEYDQLLDYVNVYEKLLEEKSKNQHEYKNQLIIIRDTNKKNDRVNYINNLLNIKDSTEDSEWLNKLKYIPQGGLKGLIYYKIQIMIKNNVSVFLTVSEELKNSKLWKNFDKNLSDISKVVGVYLDNAIEAVNDVKDKYIVISVYLEKNDIVFEISNTYKGSIDMSRIDKEGYTTKGNGKGYGLSLVKDIINKNDNLEQKRILNGIYYVQQLCVKK